MNCISLVCGHDSIFAISHKIRHTSPFLCDDSIGFLMTSCCSESCFSSYKNRKTRNKKYYYAHSRITRNRIFCICYFLVYYCWISFYRQCLSFAIPRRTWISSCFYRLCHGRFSHRMVDRRKIDKNDRKIYAFSDIYPLRNISFSDILYRCLIYTKSMDSLNRIFSRDMMVLGTQ